MIIAFSCNKHIIVTKKTQVEICTCRRCVRLIHVSNKTLMISTKKSHHKTSKTSTGVTKKAHGAEVLPISNTFLYPYPRIAAFDTNGTLSVEVFPRNSGRIWARIAAWMIFWWFFVFSKCVFDGGPNLLCEFQRKWCLDCYGLVP